jgi:threonine aldolase
VHLDGARIFNAALALGTTADQIATFAETVQVCLSKGLSAPAGSLLAGATETIAQARRHRKMLGGGMRQSGVLAACGLLSLTEMVRRLPEDHANARRLARGLSRIARLRLATAEPPTNMVFFTVDHSRLTARQFIDRLAGERVRVEELGADRIRAVTHRGVSAADVDRTIPAIAHVLRYDTGTICCEDAGA